MKTQQIKLGSVEIVTLHAALPKQGVIIAFTRNKRGYGFALNNYFHFSTIRIR